MLRGVSRMVSPVSEGRKRSPVLRLVETGPWWTVGHSPAGKVTASASVMSWIASSNDIRSA